MLFQKSSLVCSLINDYSLFTLINELKHDESRSSEKLRSFDTSLYFFLEKKNVDFLFASMEN